jgi:hypothetical protein
VIKSSKKNIAIQKGIFPLLVEDVNQLPPVDLKQMRQAYAASPELPENLVKRLEKTKRWSSSTIRELPAVK